MPKIIDDIFRFDCSDLGKPCGECCGVVDLPKETVEKHKDKFQKKVVDTLDLKSGVLICTEDGMCVFLSKEKRCAIYQDRPQVCRDYGVHPKLICPYINSLGAVRSKKGMERARRRVDTAVDKQLDMMKNYIAKTKRRG